MAATNRKDIRLDASNDFIIVGGDFDITLSDQQHIKDIMESGQGNWKQWPSIGVYIESFLNGPFDLQSRKFIREELMKDGYNNIQFSYDNEGKIKIRI